MKSVAKRAKKVLRKYGDDINYLLIVGLPMGLFLIMLSRVVTLGEVY